MAKDAWDRYDDTLEFMRNLPHEVCEGSPNPFVDMIEARIRDPEIDEDIVGEELALSQYYWVRTRFGKPARDLRRVVLLVYRVLGFHTREETLACRDRIAHLGDRDIKRQLRAALARAIELYLAKRSDNRKKFVEITLPDNNGRRIQGYAQGAGPGQNDPIADWRDARIGAHSFTRSGWCLGLSTIWLGFRTRLLKDFWTYARSGMAAGEFQGSYRRNQLAEIFTDPDWKAALNYGQGLWKQSNQMRWAERTLKSFGLQKTTEVDSSAVPTSADLADAILRPGGAFNLITFSIGRGSHATAAHVFANGILFMDPNIGEFSFVPKENLKPWLHKLARFLNYDFVDFSVYKFLENRALPNRLDKPPVVRREHPFQRARRNLTRTGHHLW